MCLFLGVFRMEISNISFYYMYQSNWLNYCFEFRGYFNGLNYGSPSYWEPSLLLNLIPVDYMSIYRPLCYCTHVIVILYGQVSHKTTIMHWPHINVSPQWFSFLLSSFKDKQNKTKQWDDGKLIAHFKAC